MIKKFLLILLLVSLCSLQANAQNYWLRSSFSPNMTLNKVVYTDSTNFFIAADSGKVFYSSNAGGTWEMRSTGLISTINDIDFIDANTGFAISWEFGLTNPNLTGTIILKTTNKGINWNIVRVDTNAYLSKILFTDTQHGLLGGHMIGIQRTSDGGNTWTTDHIDSATFYDFPVRNFATRGSVSIACGGWVDIQGVVWRTTNNGANWIAQGISPEPLYALHFYDDNHVIAVGGDFEYGASMSKSTDAGLTWEYIMFEQFGYALGISFRTPSEGWIALGLGQKFLYTLNGGNNWVPLVTPNGEEIYDLKFANKRNGIAVGKNGAILKYNTDYVGIDNNNSALPYGISLKQNYPNPFNPETIISFSLERPDVVSLKIYDLLGKEVKTLIDGVVRQGEHKVKFSAAEIPAGVYYYTLKTTAGFTESKKMVIVK